VQRGERRFGRRAAALQSAQTDVKAAAQATVDDAQKKYVTSVLAHTNARKIVGDQVGTTLASLIKTRTSTISDYQTAIGVLIQSGTKKTAAAN